MAFCSPSTKRSSELLERWGFGFPADWDQQQDMGPIFCNKHGWFWWMSLIFDQLGDFLTNWMYPSVEDYSPTESIPSGGKAGEPSVFVSWKCAQFLFAQKKSSCARSVCEVGPFHHSQTCGFRDEMTGPLTFL